MIAALAGVFCHCGNQSEHAILDEERCEDGYPQRCLQPREACEQSPNSTQKEIGYAELKVPYK
ncbi:MAG: hypothetical protein IKO34_06155 [Bacteroidales bacterium]|nr:hypothetical protein [Bacteroidales bacterium]